MKGIARHGSEGEAWAVGWGHPHWGASGTRVKHGRSVGDTHIGLPPGRGRGTGGRLGTPTVDCLRDAGEARESAP